MGFQITDNIIDGRPLSDGVNQAGLIGAPAGFFGGPLGDMVSGWPAASQFFGQPGSANYVGKVIAELLGQGMSLLVPAMTGAADAQGPSGPDITVNVSGARQDPGNWSYTITRDPGGIVTGDSAPGLSHSRGACGPNPFL
jgi:hypothetical protein